jgi:hypothetical protein
MVKRRSEEAEAEEADRDLDEALEETFPASDPISPMLPREKEREED